MGRNSPINYGLNRQNSACAPQGGAWDDHITLKTRMRMMEGKFILVIRHDYCGLVGLFVVINYVASYQQVIYVVDYEALFEEDQHVVDTKYGVLVLLLLLLQKKVTT